MKADKKEAKLSPQAYKCNIQRLLRLIDTVPLLHSSPIQVCAHPPASPAKHIHQFHLFVRHPSSLAWQKKRGGKQKRLVLIKISGIPWNLFHFESEYFLFGRPFQIGLYLQAYQADVARGYMGMIERGESNVSLFILLRIADTLQVPVDRFFE